MAKPTKKQPQKKQTKPKTKGQAVSAAQPRDVASMARRNQIIAWVLLAFSVLLVFVILFPFQHVWLLLHNGILGLFGYFSLLLPILLGYVAISIGLGRSAKPRALSRTILILVAAVMACAMAYAFQYGDSQQATPLMESFGELFRRGTLWQSAGLFSGLVGMPLTYLLGGGGAKIVTVLAVVVLVLIITGVTVAQTLLAASRSTKQVAKTVQTTKQAVVEKRQQRATAKPPVSAFVPEPISPEELENRRVVDIPLAGEVRETDEEKGERRVQEALDTLKQVFQMEQEEAAVQAEEASAQDIVPAPTTPEEAIALAMEEAAAEPTKKKRGKGAKVKVTAKEGGFSSTGNMTKDLEKAMENAGEDSNGAAAVAAAYLKKLEESQSEELEAVAEQPQESHKEYHFPPVSLLKGAKAVSSDTISRELEQNGNKLVEVLQSFGVQTRIVDISRGPAVTRYELQPAAGVKISKITGLADDIAMNLAAMGVRIEAPIPGKAAVGVEVPNQTVSVVKMRELVESTAFQGGKSKLTVALGRDISGKIVVADLAKMPHVLIAGATGSGKSVCINSLLISLLYKASPEEVKLLMVDPKVVELGIYNGIPHLLVPVVTDPRKAAGALNWAVNEMLSRYKTFADNNVRDLAGYNAMVGEGLTREDGITLSPMPQIVIVIDELADLMMAAPHDVEDAICRLAQMARAAGMHLVIATQRPSVDVITGVIKANIPSRIAFAVSSQVDSRTILDGSGAEKLLGRGDMLFAPSGVAKPIRVQGCFVEDKEVENVVSFVKGIQSCDYDEEVMEEIERNAIETKANKDEVESGEEAMDPMMEDAIAVVVEAGQASTSLLQRRLRLGYARAGRLIDQMEQMGVVGPHEGSKPRQVLMTYQQYLERSVQQNDSRNDAKAIEKDKLAIALAKAQQHTLQTTTDQEPPEHKED